MKPLICFLFIFLSIFCYGKEELTQNHEDVSSFVILPSGTVVEGDYFAIGDGVEISGHVMGDVFAAGTQVFIDGIVEGDVIAAGASIEVSGEVGNSVRVVGGQVQVSGQIGHNVTILAGNAQLSSSARINGNLVCAAGNADLGAHVRGNATIAASNLRAAGKIGKNLKAYVGDLRMTSKTHVGGDVAYQSSSPAYIDPKAVIEGKIIRYPSLLETLFQGRLANGIVWGSKLATILMNFLYSLAIGLILIRVFPKKLATTMAVLNERPWKALSYGVLIIVLLPLISLILLMTILGVPFALTLIALNILGFYTAKVFTVFWGSNALFGRLGFKENRPLSFFMGLVIYFMLTSIPYLGIVISIVAMLLGVGAGIVGQTTPERRFFQRS